MTRRGRLEQRRPFRLPPIRKTQNGYVRAGKLYVPQHLVSRNNAGNNDKSVQANPTKPEGDNTTQPNPTPVRNDERVEKKDQCEKEKA